MSKSKVQLQHAGTTVDDPDICVHILEGTNWRRYQTVFACVREEVDVVKEYIALYPLWRIF